MRIVETHSHFNGFEHLIVHKPQLWQEIKDVIEEVDENASKTTGSKERSTNGLFQYNPVEMNKAFKKLFGDKNWTESWVAMSPPHQRDEIEQASSSAIAIPDEFRRILLRRGVIQRYQAGAQCSGGAAGYHRDRGVES